MLPLTHNPLELSLGSPATAVSGRKIQPGLHLSTALGWCSPSSLIGWLSHFSEVEGCRLKSGKEEREAAEEKKVVAVEAVAMVSRRKKGGRRGGDGGRSGGGTWKKRSGK